MRIRKQQTLSCILAPFFLTVLIALWMPASTCAALYYVDAVNGNDNGDGLTTNTAWKTLDKVIAASLFPGDVVDGLGSTFVGQYRVEGNILNRLIVPASGSETGGYITFRNFTVDGLESLDGLLSYYPANTYSNISPWSACGAGDTSGEIYKKTATRPPYLLYEDGVKIDPVVTTTVDEALALTRGHYTWNNNILYYRASDGAAPLMHSLQGSRRDLDYLLPGLINVNGKSYIKLENITVKNHATNMTNTSTLYIPAGDHLILDHVEITNNHYGMAVSGATNLTMSSANIHDNIGEGMLLEGNISHLDFSGTVERNGRSLFYDGSRLEYGGGDLDGIGIGGMGGTMSDITIHDSSIVDNGPADGALPSGGAGIYIGTSPFSLSISDLRILRNTLAGNHNQGFGMGTVSAGFFGGTFAGNVVINDSNYDTSGYAGAFAIASCSDPCAGVAVTNNIFAFNHGKAALYLNNSNPSAHYDVANNTFYNNGRVDSYRGDLWLSTANNNVTERNNHYYRSGTLWDSAGVIGRAAVLYDISHILGGSAGYWQYVSGQGHEDLVNVADFTNADNFDFSLLSTSPAIDAGIDTGLTTDYLGNPIYGLPDIGAIEYQPPYVMGTDKPDTAANVRIYGDGKFRNTAAPGGTLADLAIIPASGNTRQYLDVVISSWSNSGTRHKTWTESSTTVSGNVTHTIGDLEADTDYIVSVDTIPGSNISGSNGTLCSGGICRSDAQGRLSFTYSGAYSSHTFDVEQSTLQKLQVSLTGTGGGTITSAPQGVNPPGISCTSGSCSSLFPLDSEVVLTPSADNISTFGSWSGDCSGNEGCSVTMNGPKAVSVSFELAPKATIGAAPYTSLYDAYSAAVSGDTIMTIDSELPDSGLDINAALGQGKNITIKGGWKADYSGRSGLLTYLKGQLKISSGRLTVDGLKLR